MIGQAPVSDTVLAHLRWSGDPLRARPPVLLLHGVGGGSQAWGDELAGTGRALADAGFDAVAVDAPGYGRSPAVEPFDLGGMAQAVLRFIAHLGRGPAVLVGHSMGGMMAQEIHARAPDQVAGLVLVGTSPAFGRSEGDWQQAFLRSRFAPLDAGLGMQALAAQLVPTMVGPDTRPEVTQSAQALMAAVPEPTYRRAVAALVSFDRRAELATIRVPTLVITGEHDRTASPEVARRMAARIPQAQVHVLPAAGHLVNMEQPRAFNAVLLEFLLGAFA